MGEKMAINKIYHPDRNSSGFPIYLAVLACFLLPTLLYLNTLKSPFLLDDDAKIVNNPDIKSFNYLKKRLIFQYPHGNHSFYGNDPSRPVVYLTLALNYHFGKLNPRGYHLANIFVHAINSVLIFFFARKVFSVFPYDPGYCKNFLSLAVASIFATHPANAIVVNYTFCRSDSLVTLFYISSLLLFLNSQEKRSLAPFIFSLICFSLALFSKQIAVTLPAIIFLLDLAAISNMEVRNILNRLLWHIPYWMILLFYLSWRHIYFGGIGDLEASTVMDRLIYCFTEPYAVCKYLALLLFPYGYSFDHFLSPVPSFGYSRFFIPMLFFLVILTAAILFAMRRAPVSKLFLFSLGWFFIVLLPTSSFFPTTTFLQENRMYLPGFGIYLAVVVACHKFIASLRVEKKSQWIAILLGSYIVFLSFLTWKRNIVYCDPELLWAESLGRYPLNSRPYIELGKIYFDRGDFQKGKEFTEKLMSLPDVPSFLGAILYNNLGKAYFERGDTLKAKAALEKATMLDPIWVIPLKNLALNSMKRGDLAAAEVACLRAIQINSRIIEFYDILGKIYVGRQQFDKAIPVYEKMIELEPELSKIYNTLGFLYFKKGNYGQAISYCQKAIALDPQYPDYYANYGQILWKKGDLIGAREQINKAIALAPANEKVKHADQALNEVINKGLK